MSRQRHSVHFFQDPQVTPQHLVSETTLWLHLEPNPKAECSVLIHEDQPLPLDPSCNCPNSVSLLVLTSKPGSNVPAPRKLPLEKVPCGNRVIRLHPPQTEDSVMLLKYGKLVLWLHGLDPDLLKENDDLAQIYSTHRHKGHKGGACPKAALMKCVTGEGAVYLVPVVPSAVEPPYLNLTFFGDGVLECLECAKSRKSRLVSAPVELPVGSVAAKGLSDGGQERRSSGTIVQDAPANAHVIENSPTNFIGNNILSRLMDRHSGWPFGGLAELLHNSADAESTNIQIRKFPPENEDPLDPCFALQIDDDGHGMDHEAMCTMMRIGADDNIGRSEKVGKIGGFGVGFKAGSLANAHTAVVLSRSREKRTVSIGLLSNEPYEKRREKPYIGLVATQSAETTLVDPSTTTAEKRNEILEIIERINPKLTRERIALWSGRMEGKSGTTIFLCGLRRNPDQPLRPLYEFNRKEHENDMILLAPGPNSDSYYDEFPGRYTSQVAPMDYSFREYLSIMFLSKKIDIVLFGSPVTQHFLSSELTDQKRINLGSQVMACIGCHKKSASLSLSGAMLYCEGVLVESYARREFEIPEDTHKLGVLLVADLPKSQTESRTVHDSGFKPKDNKLTFDWAGKKEFKKRIKAELLKYEDDAMIRRDNLNPRKTALRKLLVDIQSEISFQCAGSDSIIGLSRLPLQENISDECDSYYDKISSPISLNEITKRVEDERYNGPRGLEKFKKDLTRVFSNIQQWYSFIWVPDNDVEDIHLLTLEATEKAKQFPFIVTDRIYTIKQICDQKGIPEEFIQNMLEQQDPSFGKLQEHTEFQKGTPILVPHHLHVQAFQNSVSIMNFCLKQLALTEKILRRKERALKEGTRDDWIQCGKRDCGKWRRVTKSYREQFDGTDVEWTCDTAGSPVDGCHVAEEDVPSNELVDLDTGTDSGRPTKTPGIDNQPESDEKQEHNRKKKRARRNPSWEDQVQHCLNQLHEIIIDFENPSFGVKSSEWGANYRKCVATLKSALFSPTMPPDGSPRWKGMAKILNNFMNKELGGDWELSITQAQKSGPLDRPLAEDILKRLKKNLEKKLNKINTKE